jgi:hypothetical protein
MKFTEEPASDISYIYVCVFYIYVCVILEILKKVLIKCDFCEWVSYFNGVRVKGVREING